jgi:transposase-like protein
MVEILNAITASTKPLKEACAEHRISPPTYYRWKRLAEETATVDGRNGTIPVRASVRKTVQATHPNGGPFPPHFFDATGAPPLPPAAPSAVSAASAVEQSNAVPTENQRLREAVIALTLENRHLAQLNQILTTSLSAVQPHCETIGV